MEKAKTIGKLEQWLGLVYGALVGSYIALGIVPPIEIVLVAAIFTVAYFGHWAMLLLEKWIEHRQLIHQLEVAKREGEGSRITESGAYTG